MMHNVITLLLVMGAASALTASASILFLDNFESGTLDGWQTTSLPGSQNWTANQSDPNAGNWHAQSRPLSSLIGASVLEKHIGTAGYTDINISYYRKLIELDATDEFRVKWFDGLGWNVLEQTAYNYGNDSAYVFRNFSLPPGANNNADLRIRFECSAQALNEYCRVDDVLLQGTPSSYAGILSYMPGINYTIAANSSTVIFTGEHDQHVVALDQQNHFSRRINFVWFDGRLFNATLLINQYVSSGITSAALANQSAPGIFEADFLIMYFGTPTAVHVSIDLHQQSGTVLPVAFPSLINTQPIDNSFNATAHAFGPFLLQTKLTNGTIEVEEWMQVEPSWAINLTFIQ